MTNDVIKCDDCAEATSSCLFDYHKVTTRHIDTALHFILVSTVQIMFDSRLSL